MKQGQGLDRRRVHRAVSSELQLALGMLPRCARAGTGGRSTSSPIASCRRSRPAAQGGDITKAWAQKSGTAIQWTTFDTGPLQERLFREASLGETTVDVGFLLNTQAMPRVPPPCSSRSTTT